MVTTDAERIAQLERENARLRESHWRGGGSRQKEWFYRVICPKAGATAYATNRPYKTLATALNSRDSWNACREEQGDADRAWVEQAFVEWEVVE